MHGGREQFLERAYILLEVRVDYLIVIHRLQNVEFGATVCLSILQLKQLDLSLQLLQLQSGFDATEIDSFKGVVIPLLASTP